jgi:hypothetical protein
LKEISASLYAVSDPLSDVQYQQIFWTNNVEENKGFLALPYLPYFSNCKGSDSYLSFSKAVETDPNCNNIDYDQTVYVDSFPWNNKLTANADKCNQTTAKSHPDLLNYPFNGGSASIPWLGPDNGALFNCYFEENIEIKLSTIRWYEAPAFTNLFYFGIDPFQPSEYEAQFTVAKDLTKTYSSFWGRGAALAGEVMVVGVAAGVDAGAGGLPGGT